MNLLFSLFLLLAVVASPPVTHAQGTAIFPEEQVHDLMVIVADPDNASFVVRNRSNARKKGQLGDLLGTAKAEVIGITYRSLTVKFIEITIDAAGKTHEQPAATTLISGVAPCLSQALPWLNGAWELKYDPDNSKTDWMFFNNKTCQFGLMLHDGGVVIAQQYSVLDHDDGTFGIAINIGDPPVHIGLTVSSDRSRIYNETGAYYTKISDSYRDMNDRAFRERRLSASGQ